MKALVLTSKGLQMKEVPVPQPKAHELLVRMTGVGVCSSDVSGYKGLEADPAKMAALSDSLVGHEASGVVVEVGSEVTGFQPGDSITCSGGSISEYFTVDAGDAWLLPTHVNSWEVLGEPVSCCVFAANHFHLLPGQRAAVVGCGFMGLICIQLLHAMGALDILAIDPMAERRSLALRYGAARAVSPDDVDAGDDSAYDVVVEAVGNEAAIALCTRLVKLHGLLSLVGYHASMGGKRTVDMCTWNFKAITVSNGHVRDPRLKQEALSRSVSLYAAGVVDTTDMVTYYPLSDAVNAFLDMVHAKQGLIKSCVVSEEIWQKMNSNLNN